MASDVYELGGRDPHALLGVQRGATPSQVRQAFRRRAMNGGHPDHGGDAATFRALTRARDIVLDPRRLSAYDAAVGAVGARTSTDTRVRTPGRSADSPAGMASTSAKGPSTSPGGPRGGSSTSAPTGAASSAAPPTPSGTGGWGVATVVLALLGPLLWPLAIVAGHIAVRKSKRAGRDSGSAIPVVLFMLYALSFLVLPRILVAVFAMFAG
ncbi:J domain-containing protein [Phytoactinopolyspora halotolerans]|uniref:J domain-containing protein n=1 Tax=Phytoactinopolyspora halotolerans TaxID=1981512 RepID=A0A6L9SB11_9ACTN|nr:J domain-containing protein [Phytoactinopolyspora halotolerans]NEE02289.1 J domain-containing protein [Phytoactinopolyspora halotolerans]